MQKHKIQCSASKWYEYEQAELKKNSQECFEATVKCSTFNIPLLKNKSNGKTEVLSQCSATWKGRW